MPRPRSIRRSRSVHVMLDEELMARVDIELFSLVEHRVPHGAYKAFFEQLLRERFGARPEERKT